MSIDGSDETAPATAGVSLHRPVRHVLLLSSGGADGAFGAGVLAGWTESGSRPEFDVVTGISTGALQAPLAYLGPAYDPLLRELYTELRTGDVFGSNGAGALVLTGLNNLAPLRRLLDELVDDSLVERIAAEHRKGRLLLVGTTDLTNGRLRIWDLGAIASSSEPTRRERIIGVLMASVAVPGLVEPVAVRDGRGQITRHGDGGVHTPVLVPPLRGREAFEPAPTVWIVANGHVSPVAATTSALDGVLIAGRRGVSQLIRRFLYTTIVAVHLDLVGRGVQFRLAHLPDDVPEARNPFAFDPSEMRALDAAGLRVGRGAEWRRDPPGPAEDSPS